jgi:NitT/TauT family transport system ATP-binding protein
MPRVNNISFSYQDIELFRRLSMEIPENKISCILGPSGCGKTTLLNIICNLIRPSEGSIEGFPGSSFSYIFQETRILPWRNVFDNIAFPLKDNLSKHELNKKVDRIIDIVELSGWRNHYPSQLSGGMKQRISIARAFAFQSKTILMDEAFQALDIALKNKLFEVFLKGWVEDPRTVVFVTHDLEEALVLGNYIHVMTKPPVKEVLSLKISGEPGTDRKLDPELKSELKLLLGQD